MSQEEGVFFDELVTNQPFRAGVTEVRLIVYRPKHHSKKIKQRHHFTEIIKMGRKLTDQLQSCGIKVKPLTAHDFLSWMTAWFNPNPKQTNGDVDALIKLRQNQNKKLTSWDLTEQLFFNNPESFQDGWLFDGWPHKVLPIQSLNTEPAIGHLTAERKRGSDEKLFTLIDQLPHGTVFSLHIVFQVQQQVQQHLQRVLDSAIGTHAKALAVKQEIAHA